MAMQQGFPERFNDRPLDEKGLREVVDVLRSSGVELLDWFPLGIPVEEGVLKVRVPRDRLPDVIVKLLALEGVRIRHLDGFPYGIPVIDHLQLDLRVARSV